MKIPDGTFRCININNIKASPDNTKHMLLSLPNDYHGSCKKMLASIGLADVFIIDDDRNVKHFGSSLPFFHPVRHVPPTNPNNDMKISPVFKYLERVLKANNDDWPALVGKLGKAMRSWGRLSRVLGREGADPKVSRALYTAVTQAVLLFGAETWVLTPRMEKSLESFQSWVGMKITGRQPRQRKDDIWE